MSERKPNRLMRETSPYLLQHAYNPVDWYPWSEEALERAKREDKPILLSIGYSACHWCHVMEHESFEDDSIANFMNGNFINIKVDREERPDLDHIYMNAVQMMTGSGGWPLTIFLTPEGAPFYGGTYFPPDDRYSRPGFRRVLQSISNAYRNQRNDVLKNASLLTDQLNQVSARTSPAEASVNPDLLDKSARLILARFDPKNGGLSGAPKFPPSMTLDFLLRHHHGTGEQEELDLVNLTLEKMAYGGIYDQVGGGFHRYSTDDRWLVPHFEKMLYDNALLTRIYVDAFRATGKPLYRRIAEETLDFVVREMRHPDGGFYSTQDADSEGEEGRFYLWSLEEFREVVGTGSELLERYFDVTQFGNFEHHNIPNVPRPPELFVRLEGISREELDRTIASARKKLFEVRERRARPGRDEKILTDWNGLMLRAFAEAAACFARDDYRQVAEANAQFLLDSLWDGRILLHGFKDGQRRFNGYLDDYANLADGLLALYELTFDYRWLEASVELVDRILDQFWDADNSGFFFTASEHERLIARTKDYFDSATPSGNSVAADVLLRLAAILDRQDYREKADQVFKVTLGLLRQYPSGFGRMLCAIDFYLGPSCEIVIAGLPDLFLPVIRKRYLPRSVIVSGDGSQIPLLRDRPPLEGKPTVYVCENYTCKQPTTDPAVLERQLSET